MPEAIGTVPLTELVAEIFEVPVDALSDEDTPATQGAWTSLRHVQLMVTLEEVYGLSLSAADIRSMTSIGKIRATLRRLGAPV
jgi:acyl carrier protein